MNVQLRMAAFAAAVLTATGAFAFSPAPADSVSALGITRGKSFSDGAVFVRGKYLPPPYVIERKGTVVYVNSTPVTPQIVNWNDFVKTQGVIKPSAAKPAKTPAAPADETIEAAGAAAAAKDAAAAAEPVDKTAATGEKTAADSPATVAEANGKAADKKAAAELEVDAGLLDEIFDSDVPDETEAGKRPEKKPAELKKDVAKTVPAVQPAEESEPPPAAPKPAEKKAKTEAPARFTGPFIANESSRKMLKRVNASRTQIDRFLRGGGFICFGDGYPRVAGDKRTLSTLLDALPELLQNSGSDREFIAGARSKHLYFLNEVLCRELYSNRRDYRKLRELRSKLKEESKWNFEAESSDPLF
ncbi:MAG: hypothetical protein J6T01_05130 [Kiritimatiellae bacterium]|nr:hypothetical protein [Kiritimatiellia bacterium]